MVKLLPCPFCGGEAEITRYGDRKQSTQYSCTVCSCTLETGEEWDHGRAWNTRYWAVDDTTIKVETKNEIIDALHKIIDAYANEEGYIPRSVLKLWNEYHAEWDIDHHCVPTTEGDRKT